LERFPSEFLFQGLSASAAASENKTEDCLKFYDTFTGSRRLSHIDSIAKVSGLLKHGGSGTLQEAFARLGLGVETTQERMKADVLDTPALRFLEYNCQIEDGSWKVQHQQFLRGSRLYSFAVIRLTRPPISDREIGTFFNQLQTVLERAGMQLSFSGMSQHLVNNIVDLHPATASPYDAVRTARLVSVSFSGLLLTNLPLTLLLLVFALGPCCGGGPTTLLAKFPCGRNWDCTGATQLG